MLTSPEIQFGPFTWCLEATPQGVDEDHLVVGEESSLKMITVSMLTMIIVVMMQHLLGVNEDQLVVSKSWKWQFMMIVPGDPWPSRWTWSTNEPVAGQVFTCCQKF